MDAKGIKAGLLGVIIALAVIFAPARAAPPEGRDKEIAANFVAALNAQEAGKRDGLVAKLFTDKAVFADKAVRATGHKPIAARLEAIQRGLPDQIFQLIGAVERQQDALRFSFEVVDKSGTTAFEGMIFGLTTADGRIERADMFNGPTAAPLP